MSNDRDLSPIQKELLDRADSIFNSVSATVKQGVNIAQEQLPDIAQQYILYERVYLTVVFIFGIILALSCIPLGKGAAIACKDCSDMTPVYTIASIFCLVMGVVFCLNTASDLMMVWFAPKLFLVQTLIHIIK